VRFSLRCDSVARRAKLSTFASGDGADLMGGSWARWRTDLFAATLNVPAPPIEAIIAL
jgi:hypothetical protein